MSEGKAVHPTEGADLSVQHLQAELARIDILIHREVRRWQLAGQDPTDAFRGQYVSDADANMLLMRPFGTSWGQLVALEADEEQAYVDAYAQAAQRARDLLAHAQQQGQELRLVRLATAFGLDQFELDTLLICLAPTLDLRYERLYGYLQDDVTRKHPSVNLILDLLCAPGVERMERLAYLSGDNILVRNRLIERASAGGGAQPTLGQLLFLDKSIMAWLLGEYQPHTRLGQYAALFQPQESEEDTLLAGNVAAFVIPSLSSMPPPIIAFYGLDRTSQQAAAKLCAAHLGRSLLVVNLAGVIDNGESRLSALRLALRDARLTGAIPYLAGWDACLTDKSSGALPAAILQEICNYPDVVIVAGEVTWQPQGIERERPLLWFEFPVPTYSQRSVLWQHFLGQPVLNDSELELLAGQFALTSGQIRDAVSSAKDTSTQQQRSLESQDLFAAARTHSNPNLASLARKIEPRYTWEDIVLPEDSLALLREIVNTVRGRPLVLEEWGIGKKLVSSTGVTVLFAGPPGTGKTMGAEVIANELNLDLYKIDLSTVVSKYIGETEKNLERIFAEAQSSNAILFFDEADALFGKRSEVKDAHDRYANIEISYLLQRMEMYDGVTILATNLRANLDEAFTRRLQFSVNFPFPQEQYRLQIWETLFPPDVPSDPQIDFQELAKRFRLAGGNIRNIIVNAAYLAAADGGEVTMKHLAHSTRRELQKMGRLPREEDLEIE
jgi:ATP-dependent 26S proteasome regulatory subunit